MSTETKLALAAAFAILATGIYLTVEAVSLTVALEDALRANESLKFNRTLHHLIQPETVR